MEWLLRQNIVGCGSSIGRVVKTGESKDPQKRKLIQSHLLPVKNGSDLKMTQEEVNKQLIQGFNIKY